MKVQIDIKNYIVRYNDFPQEGDFRKFLKAILPFDFLNIRIIEGIDKDTWGYPLKVKVNGGVSSFRYSMRSAVHLNDSPSLVRTYLDKFYNLEIN